MVQRPGVWAPGADPRDPRDLDSEMKSGPRLLQTRTPELLPGGKGQGSPGHQP